MGTASSWSPVMKQGNGVHCSGCHAHAGNVFDGMSLKAKQLRTLSSFELGAAQRALLPSLFHADRRNKKCRQEWPDWYNQRDWHIIGIGWGYILGITFAVKDIPYLLSPDNDAGGYAIAQVFYLAFKSRYGSGVGGIICLWIVAIAIYFCGMGAMTSNSRMTYAFSRDGAMPFSSLWHKVNKLEVPINAVWLSAFISLCMALPSLGSLVAFQAMASVATTAIYIAYALPILFRVMLARKSFVPGPFNLGWYSVLVGWVAVLWVATITVLFSLPVSYPVTKDTLNYTPVAVGGLFTLVVLSWIISARHWFKGPITNLGG